MPKPALTLAVDTSTSWTFVALHSERAGLLGERSSGEHNSHMEQLSPIVCGLLAESGASFSDLTEIVLGSGPGSFTGLRIGFSYAKGLALSLGIPLASVPSLSAFYHEAADRYDIIGSALDARRGEVFWSLHSRATAQQGLRACDPISIVAAEEVAFRFEKELARLAAPERSALLLHFGMESLALPPGVSRQKPRHAARSLIEQRRLDCGEAQLALGVQEVAVLAPLYLREVAARTLLDRAKER